MKNRILLVSLTVILALSVGLIGCGSEEVPEITGYILTISSTDGGSVTEPGEATFTYDEGTVVNLVAEVEEGYQFVEWTGDVSTIANINAASTAITMRGAYEIVANFAVIPPIQYNLTISSNAGGSVTSPGEGTFTYNAGTVVDLTAKAEDGHGFAKWTGNVENVADVNAASTTVTINGDCVISPNFGIAIYDWYDLDTVRENLSDSYVLMNDLDCATPGYVELASSTASGGKGWKPIGYASWNGSNHVGEFFVGTFDGHGYEVRDMSINRRDENMVGLFGFVGEGAGIENVGVANANVTGNYHVGGLAGYTFLSTINNSYCIGTVAGYGDVGGLAGITGPGTISNSYFGGQVDGVISVGGLAGQVHGPLSNSYYDYDKVLINGDKVITGGALFGEEFEQWFANGKFLDVNERLLQQGGYYLINSVSDFKQLLAFGQNSSLKFRLTSDLDLGSEPDFHIPYLGGGFDGDGHTISNLTFSFGFVTQVGLFACLAGNITQVGVENVDVVGDHYVGGLVGGSGGAISECYSTGRVTANYWSGGLVGGNWGTVGNSYSTCTVTGAAGLVGSADWGTVSNSYSIGRVTSDYSGGLVQINRGGTVSDCFWDTQTSGKSSSAGGTGKTTAETKSITTFSSAGWNIAAVANPDMRNTAYIWNIVDGQTYPFLSWQS